MRNDEKISTYQGNSRFLIGRQTNFIQNNFSFFIIKGYLRKQRKLKQASRSSKETNCCNIFQKCPYSLYLKFERRQSGTELEIRYSLVQVPLWTPAGFLQSAIAGSRPWLCLLYKSRPSVRIPKICFILFELFGDFQIISVERWKLAL